MSILFRFKNLFTVCLLLFGNEFHLQAQSFKTPTASPFQKLSQEFALSQIEIEYFRPSVKGRTIFGGLVPYNKLWRTGANNATHVIFGQNIQIFGQDIQAGTYALYTIPNLNSWKVILYGDLALGSELDKFDSSQVVASFDVPVKKLTDRVETFTIQIDHISDSTAELSLSWEYTRIALPLTTHIEAQIMDGIAQAMEDKRPYYQASSYYFKHHMNLNTAYQWALKSVEQQPNAYWVHMNKARIEYALGKYSDAIKSAQIVIESASQMNNKNIVQQAKSLIEQCKEQISSKSKKSK